MNWQLAERTETFASGGRLNRTVGWTLLVVGLALAALLDPWMFSATSADNFSDSIRPALRHTQGVVIGMSLLQLAMGHLLATTAFDHQQRCTVAWLTTAGSLVYTAGYALGLAWPACHWFVPAGSLVNFSGFAYLLSVRPRGEYVQQIKMILPIVCFGMMLDFVAGLLPILPENVVADYFGAEDEIRLRMMRLARVAVIALSVVTLLYVGVARRDIRQSRLAQRGGMVMAVGTIGMPTILIMASFISLNLKYLLALPATAVLVGAWLGFFFSVRHARRLEAWGWLMIAASLSVGMLIGLYAFDGPLPAPTIFEQYNDAARRLSRMAHSYCIVLGILAIFLSRKMERRSVAPWPASVASGVLLTGSLTTIGVMVALTVVSVPACALSVGPTLAVIGTIACLAVRGRPA